MPQILKLEFDLKDQDWIGFKFTHNERFLAHIQYGIRPDSFRRWNPEKKRWEVHRSKLLPSVAMGKRFFNHVDYSSLPEGLQVLIVKYLKERAEEAPRITRSPAEEDPYRVLHLLPSAPWEVVQAVYKALAFLYHPDRGGDKDQFLCVDAAYHQLKKAREASVTPRG